MKGKNKGCNSINTLKQHFDIWFLQLKVCRSRSKNNYKIQKYEKNSLKILNLHYIALYFEESRS